MTTLLDAKRNIFLVGPMGAGKSTIGKHVADELKLPFYDTDRVIEDRTGADIAWIFDIEGEEGFRVREHNILDELTQQNGIVLATGGGVVSMPENRKILVSRGTVIYLRTSIEQQIERTRDDKRRPLLQDKGQLRETIVDLAKEREMLYEEISDLAFETDGRSVRTVSQAIVKALQEPIT